MRGNTIDIQTSHKHRDKNHNTARSSNHGLYSKLDGIHQTADKYVRGFDANVNIQ